MTVRLKPVEEQVVVITGASSGIGLATARMFAARGVRGLVLVVAQRGDAAAGCRASSTRAARARSRWPADTSRRDDLERVARDRRSRPSAASTPG